MTKARDLANIISGGFTADDIPNLDAAKITSGTLTDARIPSLAANKITSGTFDDARIAASNVSQHATSFDDNKIVNDISTIALRQASNENKSAYNTSSMYVDVFQDSTGITNLTNCSRDSAEFISSQVSTTSIGGSDSSNLTGDNGIALVSNFKNTSDNSEASAWTNGEDKLHNGGTGNNTSNSAWPSTAMSGSVYFDLTPVSSHQIGGSYAISGFTFYHDTGSNNGKAFQWSGSDTLGGTYTNLGSTGAFNNSGQFQVSWTPTQNYSFYRCTFPNGINTSGYWQEIYFTRRSITTSTTLNATGSFTGNNITASSSTNKMGAIITYQDQSGTNALNTDIVLQLSADGGSNYSTATLTALPDFSTGIKMAKVNDLSVTAGTQLKYKISFANQASGSKEARIRGVSLQY